MPYHTAKPANASSAEMRSQLQSFNADIQQRATSAQVNAQIVGTAHNCAGVQTFAEQSVTFSDP